MNNEPEPTPDDQTPPVGHRPLIEREMDVLEADVVGMASRAEEMVTQAVDALRLVDADEARQVLDMDDEVDRKEMEVETRCLRLLALQQPMASDLREIGTIIRIATDIERIADLAVDIAKIAMKLDAEMGTADFVDVPLMANVARQMLRESIHGFTNKDATGIESVYRLEERVDELYRTLRSQTFETMLESHDKVVSAGWVLLAVHHVERIADHALNIMERVYYMVTGELAPGEIRHA
ncbi:MAG: phosphate signaling complex protein PhoU [Fimbriimonadaceae bacterium]|nr:phosphate signaling complex protein PhoU [Fimbriimonadaceae bacterium]